MRTRHPMRLRCDALTMMMMLAVLLLLLPLLPCCWYGLEKYTLTSACLPLLLATRCLICFREMIAVGSQTLLMKASQYSRRYCLLVGILQFSVWLPFDEVRTQLLLFLKYALRFVDNRIVSIELTDTKINCPPPFKYNSHRNAGS